MNMNTTINHQEMAIEAVLRGKEIYRAAFDLSHSAQAIISTDLHILRANSEFCRMTGYSEAELTGLNISTILDPACPPTSIQHGFGESAIEAQFIHKNGTFHKGQFQYHLIEDENGFPFCMLLVGEDISDLAAPADAARAYDRLYHHVIEESTDSIAFLDRNGQVLFMNGAGLAGLGASGGPAAVRCHYADLWDGIHSVAVRAGVKLASNGSTARFEIYNLGAETPRWWDIRIVPVREGDAGITMLIAISREITALRKEEELRRELEKRLEQEKETSGGEAPIHAIAESATGHDLSRAD